jgi:hypothetical protein
MSEEAKKVLRKALERKKLGEKAEEAEVLNVTKKSEVNTSNGILQEEGDAAEDRKLTNGPAGGMRARRASKEVQRVSLALPRRLYVQLCDYASADNRSLNGFCIDRLKAATRNWDPSVEGKRKRGRWVEKGETTMGKKYWPSGYPRELACQWLGCKVVHDPLDGTHEWSREEEEHMRLDCYGSEGGKQ